MRTRPFLLLSLTCYTVILAAPPSLLWAVASVPPSCGRFHWKRSIAPAMRNLPDRARAPGCQQLVRQPSLTQMIHLGRRGSTPSGVAHGIFSLVAICARPPYLTRRWHPGVRGLASALRCTSVQLRLRCKRPLIGGVQLRLQCSRLLQGGGWIGGREATKAATFRMSAKANAGC